MKIKLESPFKEVWRFGYLVVNPESRKNVILYNSHKDRTTVSYARYLMSVKEGRFLREDEEVDHKDEDKTNDNLDNLQILTPRENNRKSHFIGKNIECICPNCKIVFYSCKRLMYKKTPTTKFCSRICAYQSMKKTIA